MQSCQRKFLRTELLFADAELLMFQWLLSLLMLLMRSLSVTSLSVTPSPPLPCPSPRSW